MLRVVIVEDDALLRTSVSAALPVHGIDVVGATDNAAGALAMARRTRPDAALLDLDLGLGPNGVDVARALREEIPDIGIVLLTSYEDPRLAGASSADLPEGAEYVVKQRLPDAALLSRILARSVVRRRDGDAPPALLPRNSDSLSDVQWEVLRLVARGLSNAEIARARSVSEKAVEHAVTRLCKRLEIDGSSGANSRVMLTRYYFARTGSGA